MREICTYAKPKNILRECGLFRDLNDIHLDLILMVCEEINYLAGEFIFHQEDPGDALYIVARGKVTIFLEPQDPLGTPIPMAVSIENNSFGEVILVDEGRRTASARCRTDTQLVRISRERCCASATITPKSASTLCTGWRQNWPSSCVPATGASAINSSRR